MIEAKSEILFNQNHIDKLAAALAKHDGVLGLYERDLAHYAHETPNWHMSYQSRARRTLTDAFGDGCLILPLATLPEALDKAIRQSWSRESARRPDRWTKEAPALGHEHATAIILQRELGGDIRKGFALLPSGESRSLWANVVDNKIICLALESYGVGAEWVPDLDAARPNMNGSEAYRAAFRHDPDGYRGYQVFQSRVDRNLGRL